MSASPTRLPAGRAVKVLDGISLEVKEEEYVALVRPSDKK
jgi:ABC-type dipeptide/oligopeptide/nickel transport system ATPase component